MKLQKHGEKKAEECLEQNSQKASDQQPPPPPYSQNAAPPPQGFPFYPPQAHHAQVPSRSLKVEYDNWKYTSVRISDYATNSTLYTVKLKMLKPHMIFHAVADSSPSELANVTFRVRKPAIEASIHSGPTLSIPVGGFFADTYKKDVTYTSAAMAGTELRWQSKSNWKVFDFVCLGPDGVPVAQFTATSWSLRKAGTVEVFGERAREGRALDELVVMGLALAQYTVMQVGGASGIASAGAT